MNHRHSFKATVWILLCRSSLCFSFTASTVASRQTRRFSSLSPTHSSILFRSTVSNLQGIKDPRNNDASDTNSRKNYTNMILRVRSNLGTAKLEIDDQEKATESTIRARILEDLRCKTSRAYKLTQDLSFDPAGVRKIHPSKTLSEQGIEHGSMVYCRVEEGEETTREPTKNQTPNEEKTESNVKEAKKDDVIDLIDSSDDDHTSCIDKQDNSGNEDEVEVISPKRAEAMRRKFAPIAKESSQTRKRQRSTMENPSFSTKSVSREKNIDRKDYSDFQIASYNVWFGPPDAEARQVFPEERMAGIIKTLTEAWKRREREAGKACPLLFVGLQELTVNLVHCLKPRFQDIGYQLYTQQIGGFGPSYGVAIAFPADLKVLEKRFVPYQNSIQGRGFLFVRTSTILFATTHLESWCGPQLTGTQEREVQIIEAAKFCREQLRSIDGLKLAVIAGDLNWDDERKRKPNEAPNRNLLSILPDGWKDAGTPFDYTYDAKENPMLNGNLRRRFDRCIYISSLESNPSSQDYQSANLQKIGKESIPNLVWNKRNSYNNSVKKMPVNPSDHFGIMAHFKK